MLQPTLVNPQTLQCGDQNIEVSLNTDPSGAGFLLLTVKSGSAVGVVNLQPDGADLVVRIQEGFGSPVKALVLDESGQVYPAP